MSYIWYPVQFQNNEVQALIDFDSKVNAITPAYATKLGLTARKTSVRAQKINSSPLDIYGIVLARFLLQDSLIRVRFFEETFLLADISIEVVLGMPFLALNYADFQFGAKKLTWRSYITAEILPTTSWVELIDKREFAKVVLDENLETFVMHVSALDAAKLLIHPFRAASIAALQWDKVLTEILAEYSDYADIFSSDLVMELPENTGMNEHTIKLIEGKQPLYGPIYALSPV